MKKSYILFLIIGTMALASCSQKYTCPTYSKVKKSTDSFAKIQKSELEKM